MGYTLTEPQPSFGSQARFSSGRGGAGNIHRASTSTSTSTSLTSHTDLTLAAIRSNVSRSSIASTKFHSGRGGVGNAHPASAAQLYSFDDEIADQAAHDAAQQSWHTGRGGAGNTAGKSSGSAKSRKGSGMSENSNKSGGRKMSNDSARSTGSTSSGILGHLGGIFERR